MGALSLRHLINVTSHSVKIMRKTTIERQTAETNIHLIVQLDGTGQSKISTGVGFFDHMLDQVCRHGMLDLDIECQGDRHIDDHHTVEDVGIALGMAFQQTLGDKAGINRYGHAYVPLDEALSRVVIDFSGRPLLVFNSTFTVGKIGQFDAQLVEEFFQAFASHAKVTLHATTLSGSNAHHIAETLFKALGRAIRMAVAHDSQNKGKIPSTKGCL